MRIPYRRSFDGGSGGDCIVVVNFFHLHFSQYEFGLPSGGLWKPRFSSDNPRYSDEFGGKASGDLDAVEHSCDGQSHRGAIELPPYTALIYSQDGGAEV